MAQLEVVLFTFFGLLLLHCLVGASLVEFEDQSLKSKLGTEAASTQWPVPEPKETTTEENYLNPVPIIGKSVNTPVTNVFNTEVTNSPKISVTNTPMKRVTNNLTTRVTNNLTTSVTNNLTTSVTSEMKDQKSQTTSIEDQTSRDLELEQVMEHVSSVPDNKDFTGRYSEDNQGQFREMERQERFFFVSYTTSTKPALLLVTSSTFYTCASFTNNAATCTGRRKRDFLKKIRLDRTSSSTMSPPPDVTMIDSSMLLSDSLTDDTDKGHRTGKTLLTVWSTVSSTSTVTVFATNTATTVSMSLACSAAGITVPACG